MSLATPYRLLLSVVAPPCCPACCALLPGRGQVDRLCPACASALPWLGADTCPRCALPRPVRTLSGATARRGAGVGAVRPRRSGARPRRRAEVPRAAGRGRPAGRADGRPGGAALWAGATIVPVPADPRRRRRRGFDHAALIADALARRTGRPVASCLRRAPAPRQLGAGRQARQARAAATAPRASRPGARGWHCSSTTSTPPGPHFGRARRPCCRKAAFACMR